MDSISDNTVESVQKYCKKYLSKERYQHLERVSRTMCEINSLKGLGICEKRLKLAGFGHDIARELPGEVSALLLLQSGMELRPWEQECKLLCHNRAGVLILHQCFGVEDEQVFQAVEHHTLGSPGMCPLAGLLYIADFLEPKRPFLGEHEREKYLALEFDRIVYAVCLCSSRFLQSSSKLILPPTLALLKELEQQLAIAPEQRFIP